MKSLREQRSSKRWGRVIAICFIVIVFICAAAYAYWRYQSTSSAPKQVLPAPAAKVVPTPTSVSSNILMTGNTYWGRYINDWSMASPLKFKYPFSRLNEFHRDSYDAWVSGLECPMVSDVHLTSAEEDSTLEFNCSPEYLKEAKKWYTVFTLANNHTDNQGAAGFTETKQHLEDSGIQYFGNPDPRILGDVCDVISMPVTVTNDDASKTNEQLPMAFCGFHGVFRIPTPEAVAQMKEYAKYMPVVAMPHMGAEYKSGPDQIKTDFYHSLIDGGADMVIGDHPHWIQNTESYKGHLIVYSMGNFMFDQQDTTEVTRSAAIRMVMSLSKKNNPQLAQWLELGKTCSSLHDDCLQKAIDQHLQKLDVTYKFGEVGTNDSGKVVKPATPAQNALILGRLNWTNTMNQLQVPYSSL